MSGETVTIQGAFPRTASFLGEPSSGMHSSDRGLPPSAVTGASAGVKGLTCGTIETPILVVEDDQDIREAVSELLEMEGYHTVSSTNGQEALEQLHRMDHRPCLILLDVMMPVMDGYTFMDRLLHEGPLADIPVVITSASHNPPEGARACVNKPFDLSRLLAVVKQFCG